MIHVWQQRGRREVKLAGLFGRAVDSRVGEFLIQGRVHVRLQQRLGLIKRGVRIDSTIKNHNQMKEKKARFPEAPDPATRWNRFRNITRGSIIQYRYVTVSIATTRS